VLDVFVFLDAQSALLNGSVTSLRCERLMCFLCRVCRRLLPPTTHEKFLPAELQKERGFGTNLNASDASAKQWLSPADAVVKRNDQCFSELVAVSCC